MNYTDSPNYTEQKGIIGKMLPKVADQMLKGAGAGEITKTVQAGTFGGATGFMMSALEGVVSMGGGSANQVTQNAFGRIQNPYVEQVFNGVNMRTFTFNWKLVPRNDETKKFNNHQKTQIKCLYQTMPQHLVLMILQDPCPIVG